VVILLRLLLALLLPALLTLCITTPLSVYDTKKYVGGNIAESGFERIITFFARSEYTYQLKC
jgi:hypothetical protein